jgi:hypothetical protein
MNPAQDGGIPAWPGKTYPTMGDQIPSAFAASDLLIGDVISFDIKILDPSVNDWVDVPLGHNPPFRNAGIRVFDTWTNVRDDTYDYTLWRNDPSKPARRIPLTISIPAMKVTIRVWDKNTQRSRQVSFVQDQ